MAIDRVPALKRCRALGLEPAFIGRNKQSNRQPKRAGKKMSEYGMQLREKQKAKFIYGVLEKQFRKYYEKAKTMSGITGENLLILLERRADNIVYRMGLAATRRQARQIVSHGHILVNGKKMNIPSALLKAGDVVTIKEKSRGTVLFKGMAETATALDVPAWITFDAQNLSGTIERLPNREEIDVPVEEQMIVELYSR